MYTFLTLLLWIGGIAGTGGGHLVLGPIAIAAGVPTAIKALATPNDMETFCGLLLMLFLGISAVRIVLALLP